jgi:hypothetical protein
MSNDRRSRHALVACPRCARHVLVEAARVCAFCGAPLESSPEASPDAAPTKSGLDRLRTLFDKRMRVMAASIVGIGVAAASCGTDKVSTLNGGSSEDASTSDGPVIQPIYGAVPADGGARDAGAGADAAEPDAGDKDALPRDAIGPHPVYGLPPDGGA